MGIFPYMLPFVMGDKKLKQPFRSSLCACTCVDIAVAYAIMKLTGQMPEINPQTCTISLPKWKVIPLKKRKSKAKPSPLSAPATAEIPASKANPMVNCNSVVNFLKGGKNEHKLEESKTAPKGTLDPLLKGINFNALENFLNETADDVCNAHGNKFPRIYFLKEPKNFKFGAAPKNLISYFNGENIGRRQEVIQLQPGQGAVCFLEFATESVDKEGNLRSHACIVCGYGPDEKGVMCLDVYNPEIMYSSKNSGVDAKEGNQIIYTPDLTNSKKLVPENPLQIPLDKLKDVKYANLLMWGKETLKNKDNEYKFNRIKLFRFQTKPFESEKAELSSPTPSPAIIPAVPKKLHLAPLYLPSVVPRLPG